MDLRLRDKIALVTGASSGIGQSTAMLFAREGAHVVISYAHNQAAAEATAESVRALGQKAWLLRIDLSERESIESASAWLHENAQGIDALVLCAGLNIVTPFAELDWEEWEQVLRVNLSGPFYALRCFAPLLSDGAGVVTVASVAANTGAPHHPHYAAAKAGLVNLTKSAARALAPRVRVNCVSPGITLTPMGIETAASLDPGYAKSKLLLQRFADPEEVARVIVFTASPANSFMTGATLDINGGRDLR